MQQVIQLVYYQGLKYREAAEALEIPVGTVKSRLHAAVNRLSLLWDETHAKTRDGDPTELNSADHRDEPNWED